ncbi:MAG: hypothetical protein GY832_01860 [Chloroflexi bacterium]|nr:hypothetical protein [Chloroflexota bacterium]
MTAIQDRKEQAVSLVMDGAVAQADIPHHYQVQDCQVKARFDWEILSGYLLDATCTCSDWHHQQEAVTEALDDHYSPFSLDIAQVDGIPLCQHVLAVAFDTGALAWPKWAPVLTMQLPTSITV